MIELISRTVCMDAFRRPTATRALTLAFAAVAMHSACGEDASDDEQDDPQAAAVDEAEPAGEAMSYSDGLLAVLELPFPPADYTSVPDALQDPAVAALDNTPSNNTITNEGATLGRVLFYDKALSANRTISCASCHAPATGFSDSNRYSEGYEGGLTGRNSMALANSRFYPSGRFFWDERAATLEDQVLMPIQDAVEMGLSLETLVEAVSEQPYYAELFERAFGDEEATAERISFALAQFVRAMVSAGSRYDDGLAAAGSATTDFDNFTEQENLGKKLFFTDTGNCATCHVAGFAAGNEVVFQAGDTANIGLDAEPEDEGAGMGRFKSGSLRNIAESGPYMHDGRFDTLEQVIEFYNSGVQDSEYLDPRMRNEAGEVTLGLQSDEVEALVAFLRTLTDRSLLEDPRFQDPFK